MMVSFKSLTAVFLSAGLCRCQTSTTTTSSATSAPICGLKGWDSGNGNIGRLETIFANPKMTGYYADTTSTAYSSYTACDALCDSDTSCESFAYDAGVACILYATAAENNVVADSTSPWTFFNRGGACPVTSTTTGTASSTAATATATPTCTGFEGYDAGGTNIGYYSDASSATYAGCLALCDANSDCLSFGLTSTPACILYDYTVEGNDVSSSGSGNTFYDRGGACPSTTTSAVGTTTSSVTTPIQTGAFANCPSNLYPYNVSNVLTPYSPCNSSYPYSACMSDNDGISTFCNLCLSCTNTTCSTDSDCGDGYACIKDSDCPVTGQTTGTPVCLYMLAGGSAYGCYDQPES